MSSTLADFFKNTGTACEALTGTPLWLHGNNSVWLTSIGPVDVFLARICEGQPDGALKPLFRIEAGQLLCGMPDIEVAGGWGLVAMGAPGNSLIHLERTYLLERARKNPVVAKQTVELLDHWMEKLILRMTEFAPSSVTLLDPNVEYLAVQDQVFFAQQQTLWLTSTTGEFRFFGQVEHCFRPNTAFFPLPRLSWLVATGESVLLAQTGENCLSQEAGWAGLDAFHAIQISNLINQAAADDEQEQYRIAKKSANETQSIGHAMLHLSATLDKDNGSFRADETGISPLLATCRLVGSASGIIFASSNGNNARGEAKDNSLDEIVNSSRIRHRKVDLKGEWWRNDSGNMLGFIQDGDRPAALLQTATGYVLHDHVQGTTLPITSQVAATLQPFAFIFYRSFGDTLVSLMQIVKFSSHGNSRDFLMVLMMGVAIGMLGMVVPIATGMLFNTVIPGAEKDQLAQLSLALLAGALASAMFEVTRGFALLRAEGKMDSSLQSAIWDRLLRLPAAFFRDFTAGDLANRANGINAIRQTLSGTTLNTLLAAVFSAFNLLLLFYYSIKLALLGILLVAVALIFTFGASYLRLHHERKLADIEGHISGLVFQLLGGIAKLRTTGAENRAFLNWAMLFARQQRHQFKATLVRSSVEVFNSVFPTIANIAIFFTIAVSLGQDRSFSTGDFLAFNAAFGSFLGAMLSIAGALVSALDIIPVYERARPILQTPPEVTENKVPPGQLSGEIEISHLSFRYSPAGPSVLKDISLHIRPGEFVALVGSSGSGKSSLLRLLLGFETPVSGSIYYDRQDIASIDLGALRRQLGVVLQSGQLLSGDIFTNIVGSATTLTLDDAWEAANQAGIADDIHEMPMGMQTLVSDGGGTLSGGQRQRLLIARAIVNRPRILFFDEATSALDNRTQEIVSSSLNQLRATRIVIAHRLSTIVHADRIFVLDGGQLVQAGTYEELIHAEGLFADLAKRQIV